MLLDGSDTWHSSQVSKSIPVRLSLALGAAWSRALRIAPLKESLKSLKARPRPKV
jgi:hypothetical protein